MGFKFKVFIIPIIVGIWFPLTFVITYVIAVCNNDVAPIFPYISDTGTWSPESCIFGLMLNVGALMQASVIYIRYRQIRDLCDKNNFKAPVLSINKISMILGIIAAFGVSIVGNFQETQVFVVHTIGALAAFGLGSVYQLMQTQISFRIFPIFGSKKLNIVRLCCSIISSVTFCTTFILAVIALRQFTGDDITKWSKDDNGYTLHIISAITEWIMALSTILFLVLFTSEFRLISIAEPIVSNTFVA